MSLCWQQPIVCYKHSGWHRWGAQCMFNEGWSQWWPGPWVQGIVHRGPSVSLTSTAMSPGYLIPPTLGRNLEKSLRACWILFFFFLAVPCSTLDLSFLTRDQTCVPCSGSTVLTTGSAGKSQEPVELRCCPLTVVGPGAHYFASLNLSFWLCSLTIIRTYHK